MAPPIRVAAASSSPPPPPPPPPTPPSPPPPPPTPQPPPAPSALVQYATAFLFLVVFTLVFVVPVLVGAYTMAVVLAVEGTACLNAMRTISQVIFKHMVVNAHIVMTAALGLFTASAILLLSTVDFGVDDYDDDDDECEAVVSDTEVADVDEE